VGTAHEVRHRRAWGRDRVPAGVRPRAGAPPRGRTETNVQQLPARPAPPGVLRDRARNPAVLVHRLLKDPSLRSTETGRTLLRLLDAQAHVMQSWDRLVDGVPQHCSEIIADLANEYAKFWHEFAAQSHTVAHGGDRQISG
ncbi:hypothetical protein ACFWUX_10865, partial [Streptomyces sp. NPDC058625]